MERVESESENESKEDLDFEIVDARNEINRYTGTLKAAPGADRVQIGLQLVKWHAHEVLRVAPVAEGSMELSFLRVRLGGAAPSLFASLMMPRDQTARQHMLAEDLPGHRQHAEDCMEGKFAVRVRLATESDRELALSMLHGVPRQATGALVLLGFGEPLPSAASD